MSSRTKLLVAVGVVATLAVSGWYLVSPLFFATRGEEEAPTGFSSLATGTFVDGEPGHHSSGRALLLQAGSEYVLRFEDFSVTNGPGLHVYLARGPRVAEGDLDLGSLKASQGASNYPLPGGVNPRAYDYVVIWCVPFSVQFGYARLAFA